ncbi:MAG: hypothetical protein AAB215_03450 [Planctomycetota bacterium]
MTSMQAERVFGAGRSRWLLAGLCAFVLALATGRVVRAAGAESDEALAQKACEVLRAAGIDPSTVKAPRTVSKAVLTAEMKVALTKAGLDVNAVAVAFKKFPPAAGGEPLPATLEPKSPAKPPKTKGGKEPALPSEPVEPPPPANPGAGGPGGGTDLGPADGFGNKATGGTKEVKAGSAAELASAVKQAGAKVLLAPGDYEVAGGQIVMGSNVTLDGGGATLWLPGTGHNSSGVCMFGTNMILRNIRIRNAGDCIDLGNSSWRKTSDALIERVTVSGSGDDGFSPSYGTRNTTIRWSAALGCTRAVFIKYGDATDITIHHTILSHYWMRGPMLEGEGNKCDFRNNLVQHWQMWGSKPYTGALINFINNTWRFDKSFDLGKEDAAVCTAAGGKFYASGNQFIGCTERKESQPAALFAAPPINGQTDAKTAMDAVLSETTGAGCMPRDEIDKAYLEFKGKWPPEPNNKGITHGLQVPATEKRLRGAK